MASYKLQAKNKKTGEIVEIIVSKDEYFLSGYGYKVNDGSKYVFGESTFNELYEPLKEEILEKIVEKWEKEAIKACELEETPVSSYHLQKERDRLVREIELYFKGLIAITDPQKTKENLIKLILNK